MELGSSLSINARDQRLFKITESLPDVRDWANELRLSQMSGSGPMKWDSPRGKSFSQNPFQHKTDMKSKKKLGTSPTWMQWKIFWVGIIVRVSHRMQRIRGLCLSGRTELRPAAVSLTQYLPGEIEPSFRASPTTEAVELYSYFLIIYIIIYMYIVLQLSPKSLLVSSVMLFLLLSKWST